MLSVMALLEDAPEEGLVRGQVGTLLENWAPGIYEVEFCDDNGKPYAMAGRSALFAWQAPATRGTCGV
ncbi:MAG: DUF4926 domain-containing protein [Bryobacteraceae bacterium]